jgi:hypothetical protein
MTFIKNDKLKRFTGIDRRPSTFKESFLLYEPTVRDYCNLGRVSDGRWKPDYEYGVLILNGVHEDPAGC